MKRLRLGAGTQESSGGAAKRRQQRRADAGLKAASGRNFEDCSMTCVFSMSFNLLDSEGRILLYSFAIFSILFLLRNQCKDQTF